MSLVQSVVDGKLVDSTASSTSLSSSSSSSSSSLDKDSFLQLLVAQMKYQDPLEPTSNTEYISQFATFSELEEMQNMRTSTDMARAQDLVGKQVILKVTSETTGNTDYVSGMVDYTIFENGESFLSVGGSLYSLDDLDTVVEPEYIEAYDLATTFVTDMAKLPKVGNLSISNKDAVDALEKTYTGMTDYQKTFLAKDVVTSYQSYIAKMDELEKLEADA